MLAASAHLTDRDRELTRLVGRHRVLTTDQLAALKFSNLTTARHRLAVLVRLGVLRRFRPHRETGSAQWHYVLGPVGAAMLGQEDRDEKKWAPQVRADLQLALERSQRLGHMTGANWFFAALARHAREHGDGELLQWDGEGEASDYLYARQRELGPRPRRARRLGARRHRHRFPARIRRRHRAPAPARRQAHRLRRARPDHDEQDQHELDPA